MTETVETVETAETAGAQPPSNYTEGNFARVTEEVTAFDLEVIGEIPAAFEGRYLRNGPNPVVPTDPATSHWFTGTGMVHGVRLRDGRAEWYRNRWVRGHDVTELFGEPAVPGPTRGLDFSPNTSVGGYAGTTWALVEAGALPVEIGYELDTVCRNDFFGSLQTGFTAHPKVDPSTGEMHAVCYAWQDLLDHIEYVVIGTDGQVRTTVDIPLPGMSMIHDMSLTENYAVVYDLPVTVDLDIALSGKSSFPFRWDPGYGARVGLLPRNGTADEIIWCDVGLCYVFHPLNAYEDADGRVVIDLCRYDKMFDRDLLGPAGDSSPTLDRWTIDPTSRQVTEERVDDRFHEFPQVRSDRTTRKHRFGYTVGVGDGLIGGANYKIDYDTGIALFHDHGPGRGSGEAVFVPDPGGIAEDDGWLISFVYDETTDGSELVILDASDLSRSPVARVPLPQRVPYGFHGNWVPDAAVAPPEAT
ncbi:carotenoid oxygenase family protein [Candidatus Poriferisodalis sp.]|uniref:carotenoid oxygenase family protein n=1 Tax=Candidatus Poriferisodalis sp. TaxID=3101277 RepID=UPI003B5B9500